MSDTHLIIRCTHTGLHADGRPNDASVFISDLDAGYEQQWRKVPCYVPRWANPPTNTVPGFIDIPASSRSMLSFYGGTIHKMMAAGLITARLYLQPEVYNNVTRPPATGYPAGTAIWNTDDNALKWADGQTPANWRDYQGNIT